ncbi:hypothetical protein PV04_01266 [Phialophora macrospora]|uniref:Uncharacterized protein n=1 Tax=Phialophora macrospora TaxID=1851006 RepID=A0A0D2FXD8_9EURO|nr:hypothetical protein PV04_01266 [Phialophora macrospora]
MKPGGMARGNLTATCNRKLGKAIIQGGTTMSRRAGVRNSAPTAHRDRIEVDVYSCDQSECPICHPPASSREGLGLPKAFDRSIQRPRSGHARTAGRQNHRS